MELITIHQIVTREKKGAARIVIPPNSRVRTENFPMISEDEWKAMMVGEHPFVRTPDDPAFKVPDIAPTAPVVEGRSPRTDLAAQAANVAAREDDEDEPEEDEEKEAPKRGRGRRRVAADEDEV